MELLRSQRVEQLKFETKENMEKFKLIFSLKNLNCFPDKIKYFDLIKNLILTDPVLNRNRQINKSLRFETCPVILSYIFY